MSVVGAVFSVVFNGTDIMWMDIFGDQPPVAVEVMEGTGIYDKNKKEIYEKDYIKRMCFKVGCNIEHKGEVVYDNETGSYCVKDAEDMFAPLVHSIFENGSIKMTAGIEILGNLLENPDLITNNR